MRAPIILAAALFLGACAARPLSEAEIAFAETVMGAQLDTEKVSLVRGSVSALVPTTVPERPRSTCRERLSPERDGPVAGVYSAFVLGETVHYSRDAWEADFLARYPESLDLRDAMRLAHELTHVWQWQRRRETGYSPLLAFFEHLELEDPYLTRIIPGLEFLDYGWEQQGMLVEEFVCCRALDPDAPRTAELHAIVTEVFPGAAGAEPVPADGIEVRWPGTRIEGICR
jgi:hypothetical protein